MLEQYETPAMEIVEFDTEDVITTSNKDDGGEYDIMMVISNSEAHQIC